MRLKYDRLLFFFGRFQQDLSCGARAVRGGAERILWVEQPWNVHPRKLDREIFEDGPSAKIGSLENFRPYGIPLYLIFIGKDHFTETTFMECLTNRTDGYGMAQNFIEKNIHGHSQTTE